MNKNLAEELYVWISFPDDGSDPFIYRVDGLASIERLQAIEEEAYQCVLDGEEIRSGDHKYKVREFQAQVGEYGRVEIPGGFEFEWGEEDPPPSKD